MNTSLNRDPWPFLPSQVNITANMSNENKDVRINLSEEFVGQCVEIGRQEYNGMWYLHIGTKGIKLEQGPGKTAFCRFPVSAFPELKFRPDATGYYNGERKGSKVHCGKMFDHMSYRKEETKRVEMEDEERQRRLTAIHNSIPPRQTTLSLTTKDDQPTKEPKPMIALYAVSMVTTEDLNTLYLTLPNCFDNKRFVMRGEPGNRWMEESPEGTLAKVGGDPEGNVYTSFRAKKNDLVLAPNKRKRFTLQWTGTKLLLGDAVEFFLAPAVQASTQYTPVTVSKPASLHIPTTDDRVNRHPVPGPAMAAAAPALAQWTEAEQEIEELKAALATVNQLVKKRGMTVIVKPDGTIGLKMVVVSEF